MTECLFGFVVNSRKSCGAPGTASAAKSTALMDLIYLGIVRSQPTWILSGSLILSLLA